jgi:hypothetical protein
LAITNPKPVITTLDMFNPLEIEGDMFVDSEEDKKR